MPKTKLFKIFPLIVLFLGSLISTHGADHFVSPVGTPAGDGSFTKAWDLRTALNQPPSVLPGDTVWLLPGTYRAPTSDGFVSKLNGTPDRPITVRNFHGNRTTIDGHATQAALTIYGSYTWFWGLEIIDSTSQRVSSSTAATNAVGVAVYGPGIKCIDMVVHDTLEGFSAYNASPDSEFYGNLVYYNGFVATDRNHGHGMYFQNLMGTKTISDNTIGDNADEGIQIYGSGSAAISGFLITGNTLYNTGSWPSPHYQYNLIIAGGKTRKDIQVLNNFSYFPSKAAEGQVSFGQYTPGQDIIVKDNVFAGGYQPVGFEGEGGPVSFTGNKIYGTSTALRMIGLVVEAGQTLASYMWDRNIYYDVTPYHFYVGTNTNGSTSGVNQIYSAWQIKTGFDAHSQYHAAPPAEIWIYVRPNKYEPKRANITVYNWKLDPTVSVDLSGILLSGDRYVVQDAQDFYGSPAASGSFDGKPVLLKMNGLSKSVPIGFSPPAHTAPEFGTFILLPAAPAATEKNPH
jgi:hypothetical protein